MLNDQRSTKLTQISVHICLNLIIDYYFFEEKLDY